MVIKFLRLLNISLISWLNSTIAKEINRQYNNYFWFGMIWQKKHHHEVLVRRRSQQQQQTRLRVHRRRNFLLLRERAVPWMPSHSHRGLLACSLLLLRLIPGRHSTKACTPCCQRKVDIHLLRKMVLLYFGNCSI